MRNYGVPQFLDMVPDGSSTPTPGAAPQLVEFLVQAPKSGVGDGWPLGTNYVIAATVTVDQPGSGGAAVDWENWAASMFDSFDVSNPLIGNTHPRETFQAPITKHVIEFFSSGYAYADGARAQIAATGTPAVTLYVVLPMAHELNDRPQHSAFWLGWLNATKVQAWIATATAVANFSTGAVIGAPVSVRGWIEYVVSDELIMPVVNQWHRYTAAAGGQGTHIITGIGSPNGLQSVKDGSRIVALLELTAIAGFGGATTADNYASYNLPQLSQDVTVNIDAYFSAFRRVMGGHRGPISFGASTSVVEDSGGGPIYLNATTMPANSKLNTNAAKFIPVRAPGRNFMLTKQPKFFGDMKRVATFTATPASGQYPFLLNEFRELGDDKKREMIAKTGRAGKLMRIWSNGHAPDNTTSTARKQAGKGREAVLPERVVF